MRLTIFFLFVTCGTKPAREIEKTPAMSTPATPNATNATGNPFPSTKKMNQMPAPPLLVATGTKRKRVDASAQPSKLPGSPADDGAARVAAAQKKTLAVPASAERARYNTAVYTPLTEGTLPLAPMAFLTLVPNILPEALVLAVLKELNALPLQPNYIQMFGKRIRLPRLQYGLGTGSYRFSGMTVPAASLIPYPALQCLLDKVNSYLGSAEPEKTFMLINKYDPDSSIGMHSDDEKDLLKKSSIASVSFGASADFVVQDRDHKKGGLRHRVQTGHNQLMIMAGRFQETLKHGIPRSTTKRKDTRWNITLRSVHSPA